MPGVTAPRATSSAPLILGASALTGAVTLAAEMLWIRGLGRGVGTTQEAAATVVGLVLAGLGLGAVLGARTAPGSKRPARRGALLLLSAGLWTALSPLYVRMIGDLHGSLFDGAPGGILPPLALALPLVLVPSVCLGAVFPYLVRARVHDVHHAGGRAGMLYAANTAGGVLGIVLLLPAIAAFGEALALRGAGAAGVVGALLLLLADRPLPHGDGPPAQGTPGKALAAGGLGPVLFASGAAALLAQLAWLRMLQPLAGAHLYGVALLLGPLLVVLALGSACAGFLADRLRHPSLLVPALLSVAGALLLLSLPVAGAAPFRVASAAAEGDSHLTSLIFAFLFTVAPATFVFGALLPTAIRLRSTWTGHVSGPAGRLYAWNTFGALTGSLLAGYLLLPKLGAERTLFLAAVIAVVAGVVARWSIPSQRRAPVAALHALPLLVLLWPGLLSGWIESGPSTVELIAARKPVPAGLALESREDFALYATWFGGRRAQRPGDPNQALLPQFEGRGGRITLIEEVDGRIGLRRGVLRESIFDGDDPSVPARTEFALGLLPTLLHTAPERALVIGHGAGWTAEAVMAAGVGDIDVAEIDPAVLDAARAVRGVQQLPIERAPGASVIGTDGRVLLRRAGRAAESGRYDVIASQPSHPWHPSSGHLFTKEAYAAARDALRTDGVLAQWLNLFDMTPDLLRSALASFRAVFDHVWVFRFPDELVLVGFRDAPRLDPGRWEVFFDEKNRRAAGARAAGFRKPGDLWKHFALDTAGLDRVVPADVAPLTDDVPRLELALARRRLSGADPEHAALLLLPGFPPDIAAALPQAAVRERWLTDGVLSWLDEGATAEANIWSQKIRWGFSADGRMAQARAALASDQPQRAETILRAARQLAPERGDLAALWIRAATALQGRGDATSDARLLAYGVEIVKAMPNDGRVLAAAARMERGRGGISASRSLFERAVAATSPGPPDGVRIQLARLLLSGKASDQDIERARKLLAADPGTFANLDGLDLLLRLTSAMGDEDESQEFEAALTTLQRTRGLALLRTASSLLARHEFAAAVEAAQRCTEVWASKPQAFEIEALGTLASIRADPPENGNAAPFEADAVAAFREAIERSSDKAAARRRAERVLAWFGVDAANLVVTPAPDTE